MDKLIAVTGAYGGLGSSVAASLANDGYDLLLGGRDLNKLDFTRASLLDKFNISVYTAYVDVASEESVSDFFSKADGHPFAGLVHTAAITGPASLTTAFDAGSWEQVIQVNLIGSYFVLKHALPRMQIHGRGNIILLSGGGASNSLPMMSAYASSKTAIVRLVETVADEISGSGVGVYAMAPGILATEMNTGLLANYGVRLGEEYVSKITSAMAGGAASMEKATGLIGFLLRNTDSRLFGRLISAQWDDWQSWDTLPKNFDSDDLYKLRRVVGV